MARGLLGTFTSKAFTEAMTDTAIGAGVGAVSAFAWEAGVERLAGYGPFKKLPAVAFPVAEIIAGAVGGPLLAMKFPQAGLGMGMVLAATGLNRVAKMYAPATLMPSAQANAGAGTTAGLGATREDSLLLGDSSQEVENVQPGLGDSAVEVETVEEPYQNVGAWIG